MFALRCLAVSAVVSVACVVAAAPATAAPTVPFKASVSGESAFDLTTGAGHVALTGRATHLGNIELEEHGQLVPTGVASWTWSSTWTLTAANGAQLVGTCSGPVTTTDGLTLEAVLQCASTHGTGRLEDARLTFTANVVDRITSVSGTTGLGSARATALGSLDLGRH